MWKVVNTSRMPDPLNTAQKYSMLGNNLFSVVPNTYLVGFKKIFKAVISFHLHFIEYYFSLY